MKPLPAGSDMAVTTALLTHISGRDAGFAIRVLDAKSSSWNTMAAWLKGLLQTVVIIAFLVEIQLLSARLMRKIKVVR